jgi:hypothetical protein
MFGKAVMRNVLLFWPSIIGGLSVLAVLNFAVHAAEPGNTQLPARVKLAVAAPDSIKDSVTSYFHRELRALSDVRLVNDKPDWEISVVALEIRSTRGYRGGIAISTVVLPRFNNEAMTHWFRREAKNVALAQTSNLWYRPRHYLQMDASDRLQIMCKEIVADFDTKYLEPSRRKFREMQESMEKIK